MKKIILIACIVALAAMNPTAKALVVDLVADGGDATTATVVGTVEVTRDNGNLVVTFNTTGGWTLSTTHVGLALDPDDIDGNKGNPSPGQFQYSDGDYPTTSHSYSIPLDNVLGGLKKDKNAPVYDWSAGGVEIIVAAHAVVETLCTCDTDTCEELDLPSDVIVSVLHAGDPGASGDSYFDATIVGGTILDGFYSAWCVDTDRSIRPVGLGRGIPLQAYVYCDDCEGLPTEGIGELLIENCGNMGKVNWIINNINIGQAIGGCAGNVTRGDIQLAIWDLVDDNRPSGSSSSWGLGAYSECRVAAIIAAAEADELANGVFMPICGEEIAIIILPYVFMLDGVVLVGDNPAIPRYDNLPAEAVLVYVQPIIIQVPVPCCVCDETAWGGIPVTLGGPDDSDENGWGLDFPGNDWAMYIEFLVPTPAP